MQNEHEHEDIVITTEELTPLPPVPETSEVKGKKKSRDRKVGWLVRDLFEWGETLVSAVIAIVVIFTFIMRVTSVDGESMLPTLQDGDQMLVTNFFYTPKHNDIVVAYAPNLNNPDEGKLGKNVIKRVIGVAGDKIRIEPLVYGAENAGIVYINDEPLPLSIIDGQLTEDGHWINDRTYSLRQTEIELVVPDGFVFVMGDNRNNSTDSRCTSVDLVDVNYIAGRAFFRLAGDPEKWEKFYNAFGFVQ